MKKLKKIIIYILFIIIIFTLLLYFINDKNNNILTKNIKNLSANISKIIYYPLYFNNSKNYIKDENIVLKKEIQELKEELELKNTDKKLINASVIKRSTSFFYNILTIDKGEKDNIKKNNIVFNKYGVIGYIIKTTKTSSDVKLLTSKNINLSVMFNYNNNYYYGIIDNYNIKNNELYLKNVIGDFDNIKDIDVVTSGLSLNEEKGLLIGKIKKIKKEQYGLSNTVVVTPSVNFNKLNYVSIEVNDE